VKFHWDTFPTRYVPLYAPALVGRGAISVAFVRPSVRMTVRSPRRDYLYQVWSEYFSRLIRTGIRTVHACCTANPTQRWITVKGRCVANLISLLVLQF